MNFLSTLFLHIILHHRWIFSERYIYGTQQAPTITERTWQLSINISLPSSARFGIDQLFFLLNALLDLVSRPHHRGPSLTVSYLIKSHKVWMYKVVHTDW